MTEKSRLDTAIDDQGDTQGLWYRSPLALVAGFILFLGVIALVVLSVTGGDDSVTQTDVQVDTATETFGDSQDAAESVDDNQRRERTEPAQAIAFGGPGSAEVGPVTFSGDPLPALGEGDDPAVGILAPQVVASSLANGNPITLGPGRARVIGFFAHWCPHCQDELPEVTQWLAENELPPNTEFIAVSTVVDEGRGNYPPSAWFTEVGFSAPVVVDDADASLLGGFGFSGFPAFIAIDSSGIVVARAGGNIGTEGLEQLFANFAS